MDCSDQTIRLALFGTVPADHQLSRCVRMVELAVHTEHLLYSTRHTLHHRFSGSDQPLAHYHIDIRTQVICRGATLKQKFEELLVASSRTAGPLEKYVRREDTLTRYMARLWHQTAAYQTADGCGCGVNSTVSVVADALQVGHGSDVEHGVQNSLVIRVHVGARRVQTASPVY